MNRQPFQSAHSVRSGTMAGGDTYVIIYLFQSTHPVQSGTSWHTCQRLCWRNFNPPTPRGMGPALTITSTLPRANFNPPTPRGMGRVRLDPEDRLLVISIHPPLAGWDSKNTQKYYYVCPFRRLIRYPTIYLWPDIEPKNHISALISVRTIRIQYDYLRFAHKL